MAFLKLENTSAKFLSATTLEAFPEQGLLWSPREALRLVAGPMDAAENG